MAIALVIELPGVTQEQYQKVQDTLGLKGPETWPTGMIVHVAGPTASGWEILNVWESRELFDRFVSGRLAPIMREVGMTQPQQVQEFPVYNIVQRMAATSSRQRAA